MDYYFTLKLEAKGRYLTARLHGVTFLQKVNSIARYKKKVAFCCVRECDNIRARQVKMNNSRLTNTYNFSRKPCYNKKEHSTRYYN